jgi:hypothetical protein
MDDALVEASREAGKEVAASAAAADGREGPQAMAVDAPSAADMHQQRDVLLADNGAVMTEAAAPAPAEDAEHAEPQQPAGSDRRQVLDEASAAPILAAGEDAGAEEVRVSAPSVSLMPEPEPEPDAGMKGTPGHMPRKRPREVGFLVSSIWMCLTATASLTLVSASAGRRCRRGGCRTTAEGRCHGGGSHTACTAVAWGTWHTCCYLWTHERHGRP